MQTAVQLFRPLITAPSCPGLGSPGRRCRIPSCVADSDSTLTTGAWTPMAAEWEVRLVHREVHLTKQTALLRNSFSRHPDRAFHTLQLRPTRARSTTQPSAVTCTTLR